jgi:hypothetical protein
VYKRKPVQHGLLIEVVRAEADIRPDPFNASQAC